MFSIREVEYVLAINKTKSISKAANLCNVSQPSLTMTLNKLEKILGFTIFKRERSNNIATTKGQKLITHFEEIIIQHQKIKQINYDKTDIKVGIIPTIAPYFLPKIVQNLSATTKQFSFFEQKTTLALRELEKASLDCLILAFYPKIIPQDLIYEKLYDEEFFFVTHKSVNIKIKDGLQSEKMILLEEGNCINESIEGICNINHKNVYYKNNFSATSIEVVKAMISINNGYGILPKLSLQNNIENFKIKPFRPKKYREVGLCYRKNFTDRELVKNLFKI